VQVYFGVGFGASETAQKHANFNRRYTQFWVCLFLFSPILFLTGFWILALHRTLPLTLKFYISGAKAV
jgi:hypothetical protein